MLAAIAVIVLIAVRPLARNDSAVAPPPDAPGYTFQLNPGGPSPSKPVDQPVPDVLASQPPTTPDMTAAPGMAAAPGATAVPATPVRATGPTKQNAATPAPVNCAGMPQWQATASSACPTYPGGGYGYGYTGAGSGRGFGGGFGRR
jgi:hypothetical protein